MLNPYHSETAARDRQFDSPASEFFLRDVITKMRGNGSDQQEKDSTEQAKEHSENNQAEQEESQKENQSEIKEDIKEENQEGKEEGDQEANADSQSAAYNPETGEINWDCPCLGGMAQGPCGTEFKSAFSCFVTSDAEPKGMDCLDDFRAMQECFRRYPEHYKDELKDEEEEEGEEEEEETGDAVDGKIESIEVESSSLNKSTDKADV